MDREKKTEDAENYVKNAIRQSSHGVSQIAPSVYTHTHMAAADDEILFRREK